MRDDKSKERKRERRRRKKGIDKQEDDLDEFLG